MNKKLVATIVGILVAVGAVLWYNSAHAPEVLEREEMERELKDEGAMNEDGTLTADTEFDTELNAMTKELNAVDSEGGTELDAIGAIE